MTEIEEIREKYDSGQLNAIREDLERFLVAHRTAILEYHEDQQRMGRNLPEEASVKFYILRHRSINPQNEILDQVEQIQKEKWIRGIHSGGSPDPHQVASEWARLHAAGWRQHRVTTIIYVFDREKERFLKLLHPAG